MESSLFGACSASRRLVVTLLLAVTSLWAATPVLAQDKSPQEALLAATTAFRQGAWDDVVSDATPAIEDLTPAPGSNAGTLARLHYLRGLAAEQISWFGMAQADLGPFANVEPPPGLTPAAVVLARIERVKPFVPTQIEEIRDGNAVAFRVYYDQMNPFVRGMIDSLRTAYDANHRLMGFDLMETPVFIFTSSQNFSSFYTALIGRAPASTLAGLATNGAILIPPPLAGTRLAENPDASAFASVTVHEFNHCLLRRVWGRGRPPQWFVEGMATVAEAYASDQEDQLLKRRFVRAQAVNGLLLPDQIRQDQVFTRAADVSAQMNVNGDQGPDPYAQAYDMTSYLLNSLKPDDILPFLTSLRTKSFSEALQQYGGGNEEQFYAAWVAKVRGQ